MATKTYVTTDKAGWRVAGRVVPATDAVKGQEPRPLIDHPLNLTDDEAEYELREGTIKLQAVTEKSALIAPSKPI